MAKSKIYSKNKGQGCLIIFLSFFGLMGSIFLYMLLISPLIKIYQSTNWVKSPCQILKSNVESSHSSDGTTYKVSITYKYTFNKKTYKGNSYNFNTGSSSGYSSKIAIANQYPPGKKTVCYVNPSNPNISVISRDLYSDMWFSLIPLVFILFSIIGMIFAFKSKKRKSSPIYNKNIFIEQCTTKDNLFQNEPILKGTSKWGPFIGVLIFALVWNGILLTILGKEYNFELSNLDFGIYIFLGVGIIVLIITFYLFLKLFNPDFSIALKNTEIKIGSNGNIDIDCIGNIGRIKNLTITLIGLESAKYRQGTNTRTVTNEFYKNTLLDTSNPYDIFNKTLKFSIPSNTIHTFKASNNEIIWKINIHGDIKFYPDVKTDYIINVAPL